MADDLTGITTVRGLAAPDDRDMLAGMSGIGLALDPETDGGGNVRVLLVEDDSVLGEAVRDHVASSGHAVDWVGTLGEAGAAAGAVVYGLILLDLRLPDGSGVDFLRTLRRRSVDTPVIILTAHDQISDRIEGLKSGADDYLVKPFDLDELSARILAVSRRYGGRISPALHWGPLTVQLNDRIARLDGKDVALSSREWAVLEALIDRPGAIVSKQQIDEALYAFGSEVESNTVEVYVSRLRKKLGRQVVETVRGLGYRLGGR